MPGIRRVSRLRHRIEIQEQVEELDTLGRQRRSAAHWIKKANAMAEVLELSGREAELAKQIVPTATHRVTLRAHAWLTTRHRILYKGRLLEISAVLDGDGTNREMILLCGEAK